jgi:hypothetical protein
VPPFLAWVSSIHLTSYPCQREDIDILQEHRLPSRKITKIDVVCDRIQVVVTGVKTAKSIGLSSINAPVGAKEFREEKVSIELSEVGIMSSD